MILATHSDKLLKCGPRPTNNGNGPMYDLELFKNQKAIQLAKQIAIEQASFYIALEKDMSDFYEHVIALTSINIDLKKYSLKTISKEIEIIIADIKKYGAKFVIPVKYDEKRDKYNLKGRFKNYLKNIIIAYKLLNIENIKVYERR